MDINSRLKASQGLLEQLSAKVQQRGRMPQPPCGEQALSKLRLRAQTELGADIPPDYMEFLRQHNGLDWNGLAFYASETVPITGYTDRFIQGFIEANLGWRDNEYMNQFLVFGDNGMDIYTYEFDTGEYSARDRISDDVNEVFASFDEMLSVALNARL
jgi:SMI1 / KNR4 family (SUKH-1)